MLTNSVLQYDRLEGDVTYNTDFIRLEREEKYPVIWDRKTILWSKCNKSLHLTYSKPYAFRNICYQVIENP